jgi:hypothetical protein
MRRCVADEWTRPRTQTASSAAREASLSGQSQAAAPPPNPPLNR